MARHISHDALHATSDLVHPTALGAQRLVGVTAAVHACPD
jgi:hypothetical protein